MQFRQALLEEAPGTAEKVPAVQAMQVEDWFAPEAVE